MALSYNNIAGNAVVIYRLVFTPPVKQNRVHAVSVILSLFIFCHYSFHSV